MLTAKLLNAEQKISNLTTVKVSGTISKVVGRLIEATGLYASIGDHCMIDTTQGNILSEVIGFTRNTIQLMTFEEVYGIQQGDTIHKIHNKSQIPVGKQLLGRIIDCHGEPIDSSEPLNCHECISMYPTKPLPMTLKSIDTQLITGIRAIDAFVPIGIGQKLGIFSGSGVGKSVLLGMIAQHSVVDVIVVALIGERSRELKEFIDDYLGTEKMKKTVLVISTSQSPSLSKIRGAYVASAIARYFRDKGNNVLLLFDSITRFAQAQREIGLSVGEPPTTRGFTPSVYSELPKIVENCGRTTAGSITGIFSVLVEGDDLDEPISDMMRGLLDGHLILSRKIAQSNRYPAIDVLRSISRLERKITSKESTAYTSIIRDSMSQYEDMEELINLGAYQSGTNSKLDNIIRVMPMLHEFLSQQIHQSYDIIHTQQQIMNLANELNNYEVTAS